MDNFRRVISLLMTLVVMMFILLPSVAPPVQAVVGVDDAVLATSAVALLFLGLCGVTFASSSDAVAGVQAFLAKQADGAQRLATIASEYVRDGVLTLNSAVKEAFADIKTSVKDFFQTPEDSYTGSLAGSVCAGVAYPFFGAISDFNQNVSSTWPTKDSLRFSYSAVSTLKIMFDSGAYILGQTSSNGDSKRYFKMTSYLTDGSSKVLGWFSQGNDSYIDFFRNEKDSSSVRVFMYNSLDNKVWLSGFSIAELGNPTHIIVLDGSLPFYQSETVDGSSASSALDNAPDVSDTPLDDMPYLPIDAMTGVINRGQSESEEDQTSAPGLVPEDLVKQLQDALAGGAVLPTDPAETEPTTGDDVIDPNLPITTGFWNKFFQGAKTWGEDVISGIGDTLKGIGEDIASGAQKVGETITSGVDVITSTLSDILEWIKSIPGQLLSGLEALFVPDMAALADTVLDMRAEYPFFDAILATGQAIGNAISASSGPPVVYVHLENDEGQFTYGGTVAVLDMSFYERYKSVGDVVISSFMLLAFAWRVFVKLPGIISGVPGDVQMFQNVAGEDRRKKK